jgi:prepilin signal peptidase PulO-like enzyme (type II secretory pathway)
MTFEILTHAALLIIIVVLAIHILIEDLKHLEISLVAVLFLSALLLTEGLIFPGPTGLAGHLSGAALGLTLGVTTRLYILWRTGRPAFGGADILIISSGGGMLGLMFIGPWVIGAVIVALTAGLLVPKYFGRRQIDMSGVQMNALPLCPALLVTLAIVYTYAKIMPMG